MEKRNVNTNLVAALLVVIAVSGYGLIGKAGNLEPSAPPDSTMKTLQEIYDAVVTEGSDVSQREGFCQYVAATGGGWLTDILTVPAGKKFVLLRLDVSLSEWSLRINDVIFMSWTIMYHDASGIIRELHFPDRCVIVEAGDTLKFYNSGSTTNDIHVTGYFYDVP